MSSTFQGLRISGAPARSRGGRSRSSVPVAKTKGTPRRFSSRPISKDVSPRRSMSSEAACGDVLARHLPAFALADLEALKTEGPRIDALFNRYADCLLAQIFQAGACNASHTIEPRVAKWLIAACDRTGSNALSLTQDQLAGLRVRSRGAPAFRYGPRRRLSGVVMPRAVSAAAGHGVVPDDRDRRVRAEPNRAPPVVRTSDVVGRAMRETMMTASSHPRSRFSPASVRRAGADAAPCRRGACQQLRA